MSPDMEAARELCFNVLGGGYLRVWEFERTPAADVSAVNAYRDGVERSDLVLWLVGGVTSQAVADEVTLALDSGKPVLAFRFPAPTVDELTTQLTAYVRERVKTADVKDLQDFEQQLSQALSDLLAVRFRRGALPAGARYLEGLYRSLGGRAIALWQAAGLTVEKAQALLADGVVGAATPELLPTASHPLVVLEGDVGSGKSLAAIRYLRAAIEAAGPGSPLPVWFDSASEFASLEKAIRAETSEAGDYRADGVTLVMDGVDERSDRPLGSLVAECRALVQTHPHTTVLITTRPVPGSLALPEAFQMPRLSRDESAELVNRVFDLSLSAWDLAHYPAPVLEAIQRPLFAILLARRSHRLDEAGVSTAGLIADLVSHAVGGSASTQTATKLLARMAQLSIDADGRPIAKQDVGDSSVITALTATRLVTETSSGDGLVFALSILRDWFGAIGLEKGWTATSSVTSDEQQLERWRYAIVVALATSPRAGVSRLMDAVARRSPAFASEVIEDAESRWRYDGDLALPSAFELGLHYRRATDALLDGLGQSAVLLRPSRSDGLPTLGVRLVGDRLAAEWMDEKPPGREEITSLPDLGAPPNWNLPGWSWTQISAAHPSPLWPWAKARNELRLQLRQIVEQWGIALIDGPMRSELTWRAAVAVARRGEHDYRPIPTEVLRERTHGQAANDVIRTSTGRLVPLGPLLAELEKGDPRLECPYPDRDQKMTGLVWGGFSGEVLLHRTRSVYEAAIAIYSQLIGDLFSSMRQRLETAVLLPARLVGRLHIPETNASPGLFYYLEPLASSATNIVSIELGEQEGWGPLDDLTERIARTRPDAAAWTRASTHTTILQVFGDAPATALAFGWLAKDLMRHHWMDRLPSRF